MINKYNENKMGAWHKTSSPVAGFGTSCVQNVGPISKVMDRIRSATNDFI